MTDRCDDILANKIFRKFNENELLRYLIIGAYNTVFGYLSFVIIFLFSGDFLHYSIITVLNHFIALSNSFVTQRHFVFRSRNCWKNDFLRFQLAYVGLLPVGLALLWFFHDLIGLEIFLAQAVALIFMVVVSFLANRLFTFRQR